MSQGYDERFTSEDAAIIKHKVRKLIGKYGLSRTDLEELEQEVAMHVFQQMHRHDPKRGTRAAFVYTAAKHKLINLIDAKLAKKRDGRRNVQIDRVGEAALSDGERSQQQIDTAIDVHDMLAKLPAELKSVAELLTAGHKERELEKLLGLTRAEVRTRIEKLRKRFAAAGLRPGGE